MKKLLSICFALLFLFRRFPFGFAVCSGGGFLLVFRKLRGQFTGLRRDLLRGSRSFHDGYFRLGGRGRGNGRSFPLRDGVARCGGVGNRRG